MYMICGWTLGPRMACSISFVKKFLVKQNINIYRDLPKNHDMVLARFFCFCTFVISWLSLETTPITGLRDISLYRSEDLTSTKTRNTRNISWSVQIQNHDIVCVLSPTIDGWCFRNGQRLNIWIFDSRSRSVILFEHTRSEDMHIENVDLILGECFPLGVFRGLGELFRRKKKTS